MTRNLLLLINRAFSGSLGHRREMLNHLQRLSGLPPVPSSTPRHLMTSAVLGLGIVAMLTYVIVSASAVLWFVIAAAIDITYFVPSEWSCIATAFSLAALFLCTYALQYLRSGIFQDNYLLWHYPYQVIALFDQLQKQGVLIVGQVDHTQRSKDSTRIDYSFSIAGRTIKSYYLTRSTHVPGDRLSIRYLDDTIHLPAFDLGGQPQ